MRISDWSSDVCSSDLIDPQVGFAVVTSRASYEMVMKAAQAGFTVLAAISAPTALAIALAECSALTLVGLARAPAHVVYAHPPRRRETAPRVSQFEQTTQHTPHPPTPTEGTEPQP